MRLNLLIFFFSLNLLTLSLSAQKGQTDRLYAYLENDNLEFGEPTDLLKSYRKFIREFSDTEITTCNKKECLILDVFHVWMNYAYLFPEEQSDLLAEDIQYFLDKGIDLNKKYKGHSFYMSSELFLTMLEALDYLNEDIFVVTHYETFVNALLKQGVDFTAAMARGNDWPSITQYLVGEEDFPEDPGWYEALKVMVDKGVRMTFSPDKSLSPYMMAARSAGYEAFELILDSGVDVNRLERNWSAFDLILEERHPHDFRKLIKLIEAGLDLNGFYTSHLMLLARYTTTDKEGLREVILKMKEFKADMNARDQEWNTPLHHGVMAINYNYCEILHELVNKKSKNQLVQTALDLAMSMKMNKEHADNPNLERIVKLLSSEK